MGLSGKCWVGVEAESFPCSARRNWPRSAGPFESPHCPGPVPGAFLPCMTQTAKFGTIEYACTQKGEVKLGKKANRDPTKLL